MLVTIIFMRPRRRPYWLALGPMAFGATGFLSLGFGVPELPLTLVYAALAACSGARWAWASSASARAPQATRRRDRFVAAFCLTLWRSRQSGHRDDSKCAVSAPPIAGALTALAASHATVHVRRLRPYRLLRERALHPVRPHPGLLARRTARSRDRARRGRPIPVHRARQRGRGQRYRLCANSTEFGVCNWAVPDDDPSPLCESCRLNDVIPNLSKPATTWPRGSSSSPPSAACFYTLRGLGSADRVARRAPRGRPRLHVHGRRARRPARRSSPATTTGEITINIAEADDPFREKLRKELGEGYRTVLGHFRHEIGHYYWDRLVQDTPWIRALSRAVRRRARQLRGGAQAPLRASPPPATGRCTTSARTPRCTRGKTGPRPGRTTCTWSTRSRPRAATAWCCAQSRSTAQPQAALAARSHRLRRLRRPDARLGAAHAGAQQPQPQHGADRPVPLRAQRPT